MCVLYALTNTTMKFDEIHEEPVWTTRDGKKKEEKKCHACVSCVFFLCLPIQNNIIEACLLLNLEHSLKRSMNFTLFERKYLRK